MIAMFTKCLRPICHQYARDCLRDVKRITRNNRVTHVIQYSLHVRNVEGRVDLDPWILVLVVESFYCVLALDLRPRANTWVRAPYCN